MIGSSCLTINCFIALTSGGRIFGSSANKSTYILIHLNISFKYNPFPVIPLRTQSTTGILSRQTQVHPSCPQYRPLQQSPNWFLCLQLRLLPVHPLFWKVIFLKCKIDSSIQWFKAFHNFSVDKLKSKWLLLAEILHSVPLQFHDLPPGTLAPRLAIHVHVHLASLWLRHSPHLLSKRPFI